MPHMGQSTENITQDFFAAMKRYDVDLPKTLKEGESYDATDIGVRFTMQNGELVKVLINQASGAIDNDKNSEEQSGEQNES